MSDNKKKNDDLFTVSEGGEKDDEQKDLEQDKQKDERDQDKKNQSKDQSGDWEKTEGSKDEIKDKKIQDLIDKWREDTLKEEYNFDEVDIQLLKDAQENMALKEKIRKWVIGWVVLLVVGGFGYIFYQNKSVIVGALKWNLKEQMLEKAKKQVRKNVDIKNIVKKNQTQKSGDKKNSDNNSQSTWKANTWSKNIGDENQKSDVSTWNKSKSSEKNIDEAQKTDSKDFEQETKENSQNKLEDKDTKTESENETDSNMDSKTNQQTTDESQDDKKLKQKYFVQFGAYNKLENAKEIKQIYDEYNLKIHQIDGKYKVRTEWFVMAQWAHRLKRALMNRYDINVIVVSD